MAQKQHSLLLGAHMSIAGGFEQALVRGESIHCTTIQIFTKSNRQWQAHAISEDQADLFKKTRKQLNINPVVAHATYLINIGSVDTEICKKSKHALQMELERCHILGVDYLVLHPGSSTNSTPQECLQQISKNINEVLEETESNTTLLLENMAGQGSVVCYSFEQLAQVYSAIKQKKRIGFCFDTCHAFAAGYDLRSADAYHKTWQQFDSLLGLENLHVIHLNDSKKDLGTRVDRHEDIGKGLLGLEAFRLLFNDEKLFDIPKILETPRDDLHDYARNMETIYQLLSEKTKKTLNFER